MAKRFEIRNSKTQHDPKLGKCYNFSFISLTEIYFDFKVQLSISKLRNKCTHTQKLTRKLFENQAALSEHKRYTQNSRKNF